MRVGKFLVVLGATGAVCAGWSIARGGDGDVETNSSALADLGSAESATRTAAIEALAAGAGQSISDLQHALADEPSLLVKAGVSDVISRRKPSASDVNQLAASLLASEAATRLEAAKLLGRTRPDTARAALQAVVENRSELPEVRSAAAVSLGRAGADATSTLSALANVSDMPMSLRRSVLRGLATTGSEGVRDVVARANSANASEREAAISALGDPASDGESALLGLLKSAPEREKLFSLGALMARGGKGGAVHDAIGARLSDSSATVRRSAIEALSVLDGVTAWKDGVVGCLSDDAVPVRVSAMLAISRAFRGGDEAAADELAKSLSDDRFVIRYHAALALASLKDSRGVGQMRYPSAAATDLEREASEDALDRIIELLR